MSMTYRVMSPADMPAIEAIYSNTMTPDEPIARYMGMKDSDSELFHAVVLPEILKDGLTIGAFDPQTGELVGLRVVTTRDLTVPYHVHFSPYKAGEDKIAKILLAGEFSREGIDLREELGVDKAAHFMGLMVKAEYRQRGIAKRLIQEAIDVARSHGLHGIIVEAASVYSRRAFEGLGFRTLNTIRLQDFMIDGVAVFVGIGEDALLSAHVLNI